MSKESHDLAILKRDTDTAEGIAEIRRLKALLKAGALQTAILNSANFSSIATDEMGVIQIFNVGAEHMLGYTAAEVLNKFTPADISDPQELIARAQALSTELGTPVLPGFEALVFKASRGIEDIYDLTYIRKDGSRFPAVVSVTALRDAKMKIIGYLLIGTDNSVRKKIENDKLLLLELQEQTNKQLLLANVTLQESEEKLAVTLNSIGDAVITTDAQGRVTLLNPLAEKLTGWTRSEASGLPVEDIFHIINQQSRLPSPIPVSETLLRGTIQGLANHTILIARDGSECIIADSCAPIRDRENQLIGAVLVFRDVSREYETHRLLQDQNVELERTKNIAESASIAKSESISNMSHELRSPLNAILGFAQLLEAGTPPPTPNQTVRLHQIIKAGWYLLELINEILDLALIESGKLALSREPVSLIDVMRECQAMSEPQASKYGVHINFIPFNHNWFASADRTRIKQVLMNLLSNAIKYNSENGTVEVKVIRTPGHIRISIKDSGVGLSPEMVAQLFQPFNRLGQEKGSKEGTGIGLVVTRKLVELMGGTIGVESTIGSGSVFWVELILDNSPQLAAGNLMPAALAPQAETIGTRHTLLYVEDNPANLMLVEQIIEGYPHLSMLSARDGNHGISLARAHRPDVILMDINLPGISGIEAMGILREDPLTALIPVVAISANAMPRDIEKGLEAGFFRYLTKPIKINEFMNALNDALAISDKKDIAARTTGEKS